MRSLADLNRQKREFAASGQASTADIPWLYAIQAEQGGRTPSGIGEGQGGGAGDDAAAPNPQSLASLGGPSGGGASGAADAGLPGPGLDGEDDVEENLVRAFEGGGQSGDPGGFAGAGADAGDDGYINLDSPLGDLLDIVGLLGPGPIGAVAGAAKAGIRGSNLSNLNDHLKNIGFDRGLSDWQGLGAVAGLNNYGEGSPRSIREGQQSLAKQALEGKVGYTSPSRPSARRGSSRGGRGADRGFGGPNDRAGRSAGVSGGGFRGGDENAA